jgi:hypothetical protein
MVQTIELSFALSTLTFYHSLLLELIRQADRESPVVYRYATTWGMTPSQQVRSRTTVCQVIADVAGPVEFLDRFLRPSIPMAASPEPKRTRAAGSGVASGSDTWAFKKPISEPPGLGINDRPLTTIFQMLAPTGIEILDPPTMVSVSE